MVSVSGIRGRVGEALTNEVVDRYAAGFGAWALARSTSREIVVARDSRVSGPMFHRVVVAALQSVGATIVDLDMAPTPTMQLAVEDRHAAGGLAITASHNPIEWNALKFIGSSGLFLDPADAASDARASSTAGSRASPGTSSARCPAMSGRSTSHIDRILKLSVLDVEAIRATPVQGRARYLPWRRRDDLSRSCSMRLGCQVEGDQPRAGRPLSSPT